MVSRSRVWVGAFCVLAVLMTSPMGTVRAQSGAEPVEAAKVSNGHSVGFMAVAIVMGVSCLAAGYAVGKVGAAAMGAAAEKPEIMGRALIFVGLAEGIAIYGLIIAVMLLRKM